MQPPIINHKDILYIVKRILPFYKFTGEEQDKFEIIPELLDLWKDYLGCDLYLQNDYYFLFCEKIEDIECEVIS